MSVRAFAPAKINLTLQVGRPRADGLHPLQSVVAFAHTHECVDAAPADDLSLRLTGPFAAVAPAGETNLVLRAARALAQVAGVARPGAALTLTKQMPVASGIGGGSSDAAATLRALNQLWRLDLGEAQLVDVARGLGADVPVCVGRRCAYITGTGETFVPLDAPPLDAVLVNPNQPLPTESVYRQFDAMGLGGGFVETPAPSWCDRTEALAAMAAIGNDLEAPARVLMPELGEMSAYLRADPRVLHAGLSGSGATMVAIVESSREAQSLRSKVAADHPNWWVLDARIGVAA
jgi:4-diphosphocytidyl-2-C-methyl-D-erythritol kinase